VPVAHVELSLSESFVPQPAPVDAGATGEADGTGAGSALDLWAGTVARANEPCLVIDLQGRIVAASTSCHELLRMGTPGSAVGRRLLDGIVRLVDFTVAREALTEVERDKIPPLLALSSGRLARGLMRVYDGGEFDATVDAIATPLCDGSTVVGALTFFAPI
jgi:hypothetical protein